MPEKNRYPQIPSTVWWGVRSILQRTPNVVVDERLLGVQLGVQETASKAYINELRGVGILAEDGRATPLAQEWRLDDTYEGAVNRLVSSVYPEGLLHVAPPGEADRQKVVTWFLREGLGQGAAGNKAATYLLISSPTPNEAPRNNARSSPSENGGRPRSTRQLAKGAAKNGTAPRDAAVGSDPSNKKDFNRRAAIDGFPLNINVQIHISADAGTQQIESIFQAMRRYLYELPDS